MKPYEFDKIDFPMLKEQKIHLLEVIDIVEKSNVVSQDQYDSLTGILHLIDSIRDYAVDELGYDENEVFNLTEE